MGSFSIDIGYISKTTYYKNKTREINKMLNSQNRKKINQPLYESDLLNNFIRNSLSIVRAITQMHKAKNVSWANFVSESK